MGRTRQRNRLDEATLPIGFQEQTANPISSFTEYLIGKFKQALKQSLNKNSYLCSN